jgi:hypothetical protein
MSRVWMSRCDTAIYPDGRRTRSGLSRNRVDGRKGITTSCTPASSDREVRGMGGDA